ncbi:MAG: TraX family protein [Eubacteriales bacterium]|nr:TraX family protein [Eubacteriales bacterium]
MEKSRPLNRDAIKYLAAAAMLMNHTAHVFMEPGTMLYLVFEYIGYFTAITMVYFLVEGYGYTRSRQKYGMRLLAFAVISQIPYVFAFGMQQLNMLFTLFICFLILYVQETMRNIRIRRILTALLVFTTVFCDWPLFAAVFTLLFMWSRSDGYWDRRKMAMSYGVSALMFAFFNYNSYLPVCQALIRAALSSVGIVLSGIVIMNFYNGRRGKRGRTFSKWFFYVFYPAHIIILILVRDLVG